MTTTVCVLQLAYDGGDFRGWQRQPGMRTVQGVLEATLGSLLGNRLSVHGAARTDRPGILQPHPARAGMGARSQDDVSRTSTAALRSRPGDEHRPLPAVTTGGNKKAVLRTAFSFLSRRG